MHRIKFGQHHFRSLDLPPLAQSAAASKTHSQVNNSHFNLLNNARLVYHQGPRGRPRRVYSGLC